MAQSLQTHSFSPCELQREEYPCQPALATDPCPWLRHRLLTHFTEETEFTGSKTPQSREADLEGFHSSETV